MSMLGMLSRLHSVLRQPIAARSFQLASSPFSFSGRPSLHDALTKRAFQATAEAWDDAGMVDLRTLDTLKNAKLPITLKTRGVPIKLYAHPDEVEKEAIKQLINIAESGLAVGYVSAMPDVHLGKGVTIGSVFASEEYVCPNAVGVDIGCGMCAVPLIKCHKDDLQIEQLKNIQTLIKRRIPVG